jgi:hypothetical protein
VLFQFFNVHDYTMRSATGHYELLFTLGSVYNDLDRVPIGHSSVRRLFPCSFRSIVTIELVSLCSVSARKIS